MDAVTLKLLLFVAVLAGSVGLGYAISQALRIREYFGKLSVLFFTIFLSLSPFINTVAVDGRPAMDAVRFGIDLAGGTNLVYQLVTPPKPGAGDVMGNMVGSVRKRIDPAGTQELVVRQVGRDKLEIIIPRATPEAIANIKQRMLQVGKLEFSILAATHDLKHQELIRLAQQVPRDLLINGKVVAGWRPIAPTITRNASGKPERRPNTDFGLEEIATRQIKGQPEGYLEALVLFETDPKRQVTGELLGRVGPGANERGAPAVDFSFKTHGGYLFGQLTGRYKPRSDGKRYRLAVVLDDEIATAPGLEGQITNNGQITGNFTMEQVNATVTVLKAGALDIPLKKDPISEFSISPLLGVDVQQKGMTAIAVSTVGVLIFMLLYYRVLGVVACICLVLNLILLVGAMTFIQATFTLPGLAGIVLTMGMAVDANVLIYERMREEMEKGSSMRMAIHNGFEKAFSSIFDANVTSLLTALILYAIGSEQIKGFAVSLFIGLAISMYTALTVNRVILEIIERKRWVKEFKTTSLFGVTNFDFVAQQKWAALGSAVLILAGLTLFFVRGEKNYDIDFTGGTMVTMRFNESHPSDDVRNRLTEAFQSDISLEELTGTDPTQNGKTFRMRITEQDEKKVTEVINATFKDELVKVTMQHEPLTAIAAPEQKPEDKLANAAPTETELFAGGQQSVLTFSNPTRLDTVERLLSVEIAQLKDDKGALRFADADQTLSFVKVSGVDKPAEGSAVAAYTKVKVLLRKELSPEDSAAVVKAMQTTMQNSPAFDEISSFETSVAGQTKNSALLAMFASLIMIIAYIWVRFENLYFGFAAVLALVHDVLVTLSLLVMASAISTSPIAPLLLIADFKINMTMIAAFMTIVGYSLNDTIVIFDRLREIRGKSMKMDKAMINLAVNQTLSRTILTAGTVFITVVILYVLGGEGIHGFAYAMLIGTIAGCYSTVYIATPFVLFLTDRAEALAKKKTQAPVAKSKKPSANAAG